jgi:hypothetical protein
MLTSTWRTRNATGMKFRCKLVKLVAKIPGGKDKFTEAEISAAIISRKMVLLVALGNNSSHQEKGINGRMLDDPLQNGG